MAKEFEQVRKTKTRYPRNSEKLIKELKRETNTLVMIIYKFNRDSQDVRDKRAPIVRHFLI